MAHGFVHKIYKDIVMSLLHPVHLSVGSNGLGRNVMALWDTGAQFSAISEKMAYMLKAPLLGQVEAQGIKEPSLHNQYGVNVRLLEMQCEFNALPVTGCLMPIAYDFIIGMDILNCGDFQISNHNGHTEFSFRIPSQGLIHFGT